MHNVSSGMLIQPRGSSDRRGLSHDPGLNFYWHKRHGILSVTVVMNHVILVDYRFTCPYSCFFCVRSLGV